MKDEEHYSKIIERLDILDEENGWNKISTQDWAFLPRAKCGCAAISNKEIYIFGGLCGFSDELLGYACVVNISANKGKEVGYVFRNKDYIYNYRQCMGILNNCLILMNWRYHKHSFQYASRKWFSEKKESWE